MVGAEGEALAADGDAPEEPAGAEPAEEEPSEADEGGMPEAEEDETESAAIPLPASPSEVRASPVARKLAAERGVDLSSVEGTGPGGRILRSDVLAAEPMEAAAEESEDEAPAEAPEAIEEPSMPDDEAAVEASEAVEEAPVEADEEAPAPEEEEPAEAVEEQPMPDEEAVEEAPEEVEESAEPEPEADDDIGVVPLTRMRQQIARVTVGSKTTIPHFYVTTDIDMTEAMSLRREINQSLEGDVRVSVNDLVIKACVHTIKSYPKFNSSYTDDGIRMHESVNIGMAIADDDGLIMPAILDCGGKSLTEISAASKDLVQRSQSGTLQVDEYTGGTFSISNMGMFDVHELRRDHSASAVGRAGDRHGAEAARRSGRQHRRAGDHVRDAVGRPPGLGWGRGRAVHRAVEGVPRTPASAVGVDKERGPILLFEGRGPVSLRCALRSGRPARR